MGYDDTPQLVELLRSGNDVQEEKAADALWMLSLNSAKREKIVSAGGIPPLVELVRSGNNKHKENAARVLCNLSLYGANKEEIASAGAIPPLVKLMTSGNHVHKQKAAEALRNLSMKNGFVLTGACVADSLAAMLIVLAWVINSSTILAWYTAAMAAWNLSARDSTKRKAAFAWCMFLLVAWAGGWFEMLKWYAAALSGWSLSAHFTVKEKIATAGGIPLLVAMVKDGTDVGKAMAVRALKNLSVRNVHKKQFQCIACILLLSAWASGWNGCLEWYAAASAGWSLSVHDINLNQITVILSIFSSRSVATRLELCAEMVRDTQDSVGFIEAGLKPGADRLSTPVVALDGTEQKAYGEVKRWRIYRSID